MNSVGMIVAMGRGNVIGKDNKLLWDIPEDMKYFRKMTLGKTVVMGRNTFESIGQPLPNRKNVVVTRDKKLLLGDGVEIIHSIDDIQYLDGEVMVIGGEEIYRQTIDKVDTLYVTYVDGNFIGDTYFPEIGECWKLVNKEDGKEKSKYEYSFITYKRYC